MAAKYSPAFGDRARDTDRDARIAVQLDQVLLSPSFRTSKRCQALLSYVVHETLAERADRLKERTIGVDVFGREPTYDTNHDAVVRNAAAEVRKRLAQFYVEHEEGIRIELPLGSYVPVFAEPVVEKPEPVSAHKQQRGIGRKLLSSLAVLTAIGLLLLWRTSAHRESRAMDRFWQPVLQEREPVQLCVGQPMRLYIFTGDRSRQLDQQMAAGAPGTLDLSEVSRVGDRYLYLNDALAMFKLSSVLQGQGKAYRPRFGTQTAYSDLRGSPAVLVGAFNNDWTMRLTSDLRYYFWRDTKAGANMVADREHSGAARWQVPDTMTRTKMQEDYALVTRLHDPATERTVISAAGITDYGTLAAAEFLSDPAYLENAFQKAPANWEKKNIQVVLKTRIVGGAPGPPTVEATYFWN